MMIRMALVFTVLACSTHAAVAQPVGDAVAWPTKIGGNGHWYQAVHAPSAITWMAASEAATSRGGHLATPTSAAENDFILTSVVPTLGGYVGFGPILGGRYLAGAWQWVTGEPWDFTAWETGEPSSPTSEPFLHYQRPAMGWNDYNGTDYGGQFRTYIIEWDADCNGDGLVDFGQLHDGELSDLDGNGVPDGCEGGGGGSSGPNLVVNGGFDGGTKGWTFLNIDFAGGWRASGGQPGGYFILNDSGSPTTDPMIEQSVHGLQVGATYRLSGLCKGESLSSSPSGAQSFAVDVNGGNVVLFPATDTTTWRTFAYEFVATAPQIEVRLRAEVNGSDNDFAIDTISLVQISPPACQGDVTGNGVVNGVDIAALLDAWGTSGFGEFDCDINNDGLVNGADLTIMLGDWGACK